VPANPAGGQRPIVRSIHPVTAAEPPTCGYVDNESALPTYPQDQKTTKVSVNFDCLKAQQSDPVHHNPDRQPGQPPHPSPHSVSILAAIHTVLAACGDAANMSAFREFWAVFRESLEEEGASVY